MAEDIQPNDFAVTQIKQFETDLAAARAAGDRHIEAKALGNLGWIHCWHTRGGIDRAIAYHQEALALARELCDKVLEIRNLEGLAECYGFSWQNKKDYQQALTLFEAALALTREIGNRKEECQALYDMGMMQEYLHNDEQALKDFGASLTIAVDIGDKSQEARNLHVIGRSKEKSGKLIEAIDYLHKSTDAYRAVENSYDGERWSIAYNLGSIARIYLQLGDRQQAQSYYEQGLATVVDEREVRNFNLVFKNLKRQIDGEMPDET